MSVWLMKVSEEEGNDDMDMAWCGKMLVNTIHFEELRSMFTS
jgi:hypothetical protein